MSRSRLLTNEQREILNKEYKQFVQIHKDNENLSTFFKILKDKNAQFKNFTEQQLRNKITDFRKIYGDKEWPRLSDFEDNTIINVWSPIEFSLDWENADTTDLDEILPSWLKKREILKNNPEEYYYFIEKIKRQHAIETGVIERLYDLKEGITETFIKDGFMSSYLQHGDTNISENKLMNFLHDHLEAIDYIFDLVKNNRGITKSVIKQLHQLVTLHQETITAKDQFGKVGEMPLLKGEFKKYENNPKREDGSKFIYCPPIQVESEMDKLIKIYNEKSNKEVKPIILAAWFHHAFTQIHPFQDGNGRIARLLTSLILIKNNLFPFTVTRYEKNEYIDSLEEADNKNPQPLINFFCDSQKKYIENILNLNINLSSAYTEVKDVFTEKIKKWKNDYNEQRINLLKNNRIKIFNLCKEEIENFQTDLKTKLKNIADVYTDSADPYNINKYYNYTHQIVDYAIKHDYFFNRTLPRSWIKLGIVLEEDRRYQLLITIHHYGYDDSTLAIGAILEFIEPIAANKDRKGSKRQGSNKTITTSLPLEIKPHVISIEDNVDYLINNIKYFIENVITVALAQISNEFS